MASLTYVANLLNLGFESGDLTGWTHVSGSTFRVITGNGGLNPYEGSYYLEFGNSNNDGVLELTIDVSNAATTIDNNNPLVRFAWQEAQSYTGEHGNFVLVFRDGSNNDLSSTETGFHEAASGQEDTWESNSVEASVPTGTRTIAVQIQAGAYAGSRNNFSVDATEVSSDYDIWPSTVTNAAVVTQEAVELLYQFPTRVQTTTEAVEVLYAITRIPFTATTSLGTATTTAFPALLVRAPTLYGVRVQSISGDTASWIARSNRTGGTIHYVVTDSPTPPTPEQVVDGLDHEDNMAADSGSKNV